MATPGVVFSMRFVQASVADGNYSGFAVGYLSRPEAFEKEKHENDVLYHDDNPKYDQFSYMDDGDKTDGLFDAKNDIVNDYGKYLHKNIFDESQEKDCPLYQGVISFDNAFLKKNNINYNTPEGLSQLKSIARLGVSDMIHESHLDDDNVTWTAAIHTNTDNIHIHVAVVELEKVERKYDKLEEESFDKLKSRVANKIINDSSIKKELSQIFQIELPKQIRETVRVTGEQIENLIKVLPNDVPWQYNREEMAPYIAFIDDCVNKIITSNEAMETKFIHGHEVLARYHDMICEMYGTGKHDRSDDAVDNKLKDFYARAGNALLSEAKNARGLYRSEPEPRPAGEKTENIFEVGDYITPEKNDDIPIDFGYAPLPVRDNIVEAAGEESAVTYSEDSGNPFDDYDIPPEQEPPVFYADDDSVLPGESEYVSSSESELAGEKSLSSLDKLLASAEKGSSFAQYKLAQLYYYGKDGLPKDEKKALELFAKSADQDNPYAAYKAAKMYRDGVGTEINDPLASMYFYNAFKLFDQKDEEDLQASGKYRYRQGMMYMKGDGLPVDYDKAVEYFSEAARQGNLQAYYQIAQIYLKGGEGVERDVDIAVSFLKDAAAANHPESCYTLGKLYLEGKDIEKDKLFARSLFENANEKGHSKAAYELAKLYRSQKNDPEAEKLFNQSFDKQRRKGIEYYAAWSDEYKEARNYLFGLNDVEKNFELAFKFMNAQADTGNAYAIYDRARIYMDGLGVEVSKETAGTLYTKALEAFTFVEAQNRNDDSDKAIKANAYIQYRIGKMYAAGLGTERDYEQAAKWYQLSVNQKNKFAMYALAGLYYHGNGVEKDLEQALHLYKNSAEEGNAFAAFEVGKIYRDGLYPQDNENEAEKYFALAYNGFVAIEEKSHDDKVQYRLGKMLETGTGIEQNLDAAIEYYKQSSEMGNANAEYALAKIYLAAGDKEKIDEAIELLIKSSKNGNSLAQYALGCIYLTGENAEKDVRQACELLTAAALQENEFALYKLGCLYLAGEEIEKDAEMGMQLLTFSAELGNQYAQYRLGCIYLDGKETTQDIEKAVQLLTFSAEQGNASANYQLGKYYKSAGENPELSDKYLTAAFEGFVRDEDLNHSAMLQYRIGCMLLDGEGCEKDVNRAAEYLTEAALQEHDSAMYRLGCLYVDGKEINQDLETGLQLLTTAEEQGNSFAAYRLGKYYADEGNNLELAGKYLAAAFEGFVHDEIESNSAMLQYRIGCMLLDGEGCEKDADRAAEYLTKAALQEHDSAMYRLGCLYVDGKEISQDIKTGLQLLTTAAEQGNSFAAYRLGKYYADEGNNPELSDKYLTVAFEGFVHDEAESNSDVIQYRLGSMLLHSEGCEKDVDRAVQYFKKSANQNNQYAQYALGCLYLNGDGLTKDVRQAVQLLTAAADHNNDMAQYRLGCLYLSGEDINQDVEKAVQLLTASANQNNQYAQYRLGSLYLSGDAVEKDIEKSLNLLNLSAKQGNAYANYQLGRVYADGLDFDPDHALAHDYFKAAFDGFLLLEKDTPNNDMAQYRLGLMLLKGEGCEKNIVQSVDHFSKSATQGNQFSQYTLGSLYYNGEEVGKDIKKAEQFFIASANQGNQYAQYSLGRLYLQNGQQEKAMSWLRLSAAQGNEYALKAIDRINHPKVHKQQQGFHSLRAAVSINRAVRSLAKEYDRKLNSLKQEFDYEKEQEMAQSRGRSL